MYEHPSSSMELYLRCFLKAELESLALLSDAGDPNNYLQINDNINLLIDA